MTDLQVGGTSESSPVGGAAIHVERQGQWVVATLHGRLDSAALGCLLDAVEPTLTIGVDVLLDLADVDHVDEIAVPALVAMNRQACRLGKRVVLRRPPASLRQLLRRDHLDATLLIRG
jgi:anti-anti-sigma regulatory factor